MILDTLSCKFFFFGLSPEQDVLEHHVSATCDSRMNRRDERMPACVCSVYQYIFVAAAFRGKWSIIKHLTLGASLHRSAGWSAQVKC